MFEDVEIKIVWTQETEVESMDGKLGLEDLKIGDYVLVDTIKDGKKIRAVKIKRSTAADGLLITIDRWSMSIEPLDPS